MMATTRQLVLSGVSVLALTVGMAQRQVEAACTADSNGTISANCNNYSPPSATSLTNTATISGGYTAIQGIHSIGTLTNSGSLSGINYGVFTNNTIGTLVNNSGGRISSSSLEGIRNGGTIGTLTNAGTISGSQAAINNGESKTISTLTNSGTISGSQKGVDNNGTIGTLTNTGTISGTNYAIYNTGSWVESGMFFNTNHNAGVLGALTNSGVIIGNVYNGSSGNLTINGGSGDIFGTLTGTSGSIGTITNTASNLLFGSGNLLLNDNINATGRTVTNSGATLRLDNAVTITGTYSQTGGGLTSTATGNGASYGKLVVDGNASIINATITVSGAGLSAGQSFTIVDATAGHTGTYTGDTATVAVTNGLGATVSTVGNDLVVTLTGNSANTYSAKGAAAGGSATAVGGTLDTIRTGTSSAAVAFQNSVLSALDALPSASQGAALKQLAPVQSAPAVQMSTVAGSAVLGAVQAHQQTAMAYDETIGAAAGSEARDITLWGQILGGGARRGTNSEADGYRVLDVGLATGMDHLFTPNVLGGLAISWLRAWSDGSDNSSGSSSIMDSYQLTVYGTYRLDRAFVDGQLGAGWNEFDQKRAINFLGTTASAKYSGQQFLAKATVGYDMPMSGVTVTPMASLRWLRAVTDAYDESGAGASNLSVDSSGVNSVTQDLGAKVAWSTPTSLGILKPEVQLAWVHDYTKGPIATSSVLAGSSMTTSTPRTEPNGVRIGLAAELGGDDALSFRAEYEGEMRAQYQSHTGIVKALWGF